MTSAHLSKWLLTALYAGALSASSLAAHAEDTKTLSIELNATQQVDDNCRLMFVAKNGLDHEIENLTLEAVVFDAAGTVNRFTLLDFQTLPQAKMRVRQFDLAETQCEKVGQLLLNGVSVCRSADNESGACAGALETSSRTRVSFDG